MSMKKILSGVALAAALVLAASPAWAHEELSPSTVQTGKPTFLTLTAANEKSAAMNKVTLTAPSGLAFGEATHSPQGWTAVATKTTITWSGGSVAHGTFESFGFEIEGADQPGSLQYKVTLGFANGSTENANVPLTVVAAGSSTATTVAAGSGGTTVTTAPTQAATGSKKKGSGGSSKRANVALGVGAGALALSVIALVQSRRRGGPAGETRDW